MDPAYLLALSGAITLIACLALGRRRPADPAPLPRDPRSILAAYLPAARLRFTTEAFAGRLSEAAKTEIAAEFARIRADAEAAADEACSVWNVPGALWDALRDLGSEGNPRATARMQDVLERHLRLDRRLGGLGHRLPACAQPVIAAEADERHQDFQEVLAAAGILPQHLELAGLPLVDGHLAEFADCIAPAYRRDLVGTGLVAVCAGTVTGVATAALLPAAIPEPVCAVAGLTVAAAVLAVGQQANRRQLLRAILRSLDELQSLLVAEQSLSARQVAQCFDGLWERDLRQAARRIGESMSLPMELAV